jgi:hypothetical protein
MVSDAGDVNADGFDDVLVDLPGRAGVGAGWLVLGGTSPVGVEVSASEILYLGMGDCVTCGGEDAAMTLSGAGDVNADGLDDMLFGLPEFEDIGAAFLVLGTNEPESISLAEADAIFTGIARGDHAGCSVSWAGDFDADGQDDMVFGAWGHGREGRLAGAAFLVLGRDEPEDLVFSEADLRVAGIGSSQLGRVVSGAGDVNGDGYADFLVGAPTESTLHPSAGKACLILGRAFPPATVSTTEGACFMEEAAYGYAGAAVSDAGDVNDDGFGDMLVGATYTEDGGSAWLLYGSAEPASLALDDAGAILHGTALTEYRACSVGQAGDFDGDGLPDPLVGGRAYEALTGAAWLFLGFER